MPKEKLIYYVRLASGGVGTLHQIDSSNKAGKYAVFEKGNDDVQYHKEIIGRITKTEYEEHQHKPTKQPAKRSKKNV